MNPARPLAPDSALKILVVDDTATNRQIVQVFLKKLGHEVIMAEDGMRALDIFEAEPIDLVFMDVMMPVMDGYEATRRIKARCGERWVPVVFLSALDKDENLVAGLEAGGDDYLSKPVNFVVLQAKLRSIRRAIDAHRTLQLYHDKQETENALASTILNRQLQRHGLSDPTLHRWMSPAADVSGDVVAAARLPSGELLVMLADATGHGLAASISTVPALTLFYQFAAWGLELPVIISRINDELHTAMPSSRFLAAALLLIDTANQSIKCWVGGVPPVLLLGPDGVVIRRLDSTRLPLGVIPCEADMAAVDCFDYLPGSQLVLMSDGVIEAENAAGEAFGSARLEAALAGAAPAQRVAAVQAALQEHLGSAVAHDDVTLLLVDCPAA